MRRPEQFDFKLFTVLQSHAAMKVCTDSCAFGALIEPNNCKSIADIGTGTGLLSLMLAQRTHDNCLIDAIEIDCNAVVDAKRNFQHSPWNTRIKLHHISIQEFAKIHTYPYDIIVCNPPFHDNSTKSKLEIESMAYHADTVLPFDQLLKCVVTLSHEHTSFWCILPIVEMKYFLTLAEEFNLYPKTIISMYDTIQDSPIRITCEFRFGVTHKIENQFIYRETKNGPHTLQFINALKEYFLFL